LLSEVYSDFPKYQDSKNDLEITVKFKDVDKSKIMSLNEIEEAINEYKFNVSKNPEANKVVQEILEGSLESEGHLINYHGYKIDTNNTQVKYIIDRKHKLLSLIDDNFLKDFILYLKKYKEKRKDDFVFPFLDKKVFDNNRGELLNEKQYKYIKNKSIVYNRKLKLIQKQLDIETNLTSHVARHSFANFLLELGNVSIYDISNLMRHSSLQITEQYLRRNFDPKKLDDLNFTLQDKYRARY
jgi:site-specific recombinase XerD